VTPRSIRLKSIKRLWKRYSFAILFAFLAAGLYDFRIAIFALGCMIGPVAYSFARGRFWCGNVCPRGSFFDSVLSRVGGNRKPPRFLSSYAFRGAVVACMALVLSIGIARSDGSAFAVGQILYRMIFATTVAGIGLAFAFTHRGWCAVCPMGTLSSLVARARKSERVLRVSSACVSCGICARDCPLGLEPQEYRGAALSHPDCVQCGKCALSCPKDAIGYGA
jgi:polyferredoxin